MAINLKDLYDIYNGDPQQLTPIKGNTPFEYYTNDPEFTADSLSIVRFVAQRLGVTGPAYNFATQQYVASAASLNITDLTVYAAFEEAVTTYGNMVYQYKIRDNYINIEGSDTLPFFNNTITYVNSLDVGSPVTWSSARLATWEEIGFDSAYSQSIVDGEIFAISSSVSDYIAPDPNFIKSFNLADNYFSSGSNATYNLSQFVYNQFNKFGSSTSFTPYYNPNSGSFNFATIISDAISYNSSSFSITGSNSVIINFLITGSTLPSDTTNTFYIALDSSANVVASNIASKISTVSLNTFGTSIAANTGSTFTNIGFTSSLSNYNITNFKINNTSIFSNVTSGSTPSVTSGSSHIYFFTTSPTISGGSPFFLSASIQQTIPTVYLQSNLKPALNNKLLSNNLTTITTRIAQDYAAEANVGGNYEINKGMLEMKQGVQDYDLNAWAAASASLTEGDAIEVRRVFYESPPAIVRYFDPYAGTGTGIQSLLETFGFGQMSPGINFLLMPIYFDVQKLQAIELNDQIRKSDYSFDLRNNQLKIFPIPQMDQLLMFEYVKISQKNQIVRDHRPNVVTDVMNVPYRNPLYSNINTVGRTWIFKYTLAICREIEAHIRIQYSNMNIQGIGPLQGNELITDARKEKEDLIVELKEMLNEVSRRSQLERKQQEAEFTRETLTNIPTNIYIM
jgi:hypothetical protein